MPANRWQSLKAMYPSETEFQEALQSYGITRRSN